ncbi:MAG: hypothetical protein IH936_14785 [Acidobacteria bacterium]|nr:hypothetical protein [Acidobacteriota bacterium]
MSATSSTPALISVRSRYSLKLSPEVHHWLALGSELHHVTAAERLDQLLYEGLKRDRDAYYEREQKMRQDFAAAHHPEPE